MRSSPGLKMHGKNSIEVCEVELKQNDRYEYETCVVSRIVDEACVVSRIADETYVVSRIADETCW